MAIYDFFLSRNNGPTMSNYVGHAGRLFYDNATGEIRISDGATVGGNPIPITIATNSTAGSMKPGPGFNVNASGLLTLNAGPMFELDGNSVFQLKPGTAETIGGIKPGPGVIIDSNGTLLIDTQGLEFSFGDFSGLIGTHPAGHPKAGDDYAILSSVNADEDIVIASNGSGTVSLIGQLDVYTTNGSINGSLSQEPFFRVKDDGQVRILVPATDLLEGGVEIIGSATGTYLPPGQIGTMLHLTGNPNIPTRMYIDTLGEYSTIVARRYNGTVASPTQVLANQDVFRINATAATTSGLGNVALAQIRISALENQTPTAQGSQMTFTVTPVGSSAASRVDVMNLTVSNGVSATKFTGPLTGIVTGPIRNAGTLADGGTLTVDYATDHMVLVNVTGSITISHTNIAAGRSVKVFVVNSTATNNLAINTGLLSSNTSGGSNVLDLDSNRFVSCDFNAFGTTTSTVYARVIQ